MLVFADALAETYGVACAGADPEIASLLTACCAQPDPDGLPRRCP
jgi:hypothetical protein